MPKPSLTPRVLFQFFFSAKSSYIAWLGVSIIVILSIASAQLSDVSNEVLGKYFASIPEM